MELSDHRTKDKQKINFKAFAIAILTSFVMYRHAHLKNHVHSQTSLLTFGLNQCMYKIKVHVHVHIFAYITVITLHVKTVHRGRFIQIHIDHST